MSFENTRVLLVDDETILLRIGETFLSRLGVEIRTAQSGNQAVEIIAEGWYPHLVVTDINMPDGSGIDLLTHIRQLPALQEIPVIVVSGTIHEEEVEAVNQLGCVFLSKPVNYNLLLDHVATNLKLRVRQAPRYRVQLPGTLHLASSTVTATTRDLSVLGLFCDVTSRLELGRSYALDLDFPADSGLGRLRFEIEPVREVRRDKIGTGVFGYGCKIVNSTEHRQRSLQEFFASLPAGSRE